MGTYSVHKHIRVVVEVQISNKSQSWQVSFHLRCSTGALLASGSRKLQSRQQDPKS